MSSFELRPHHGLCIGFFEGKGYSPAFTAHMAEVICALRAQDPSVTLTVSTRDTLCGHCPHNVGAMCESAEKVEAFDRAVLRLCGLSEGDTLPWGQFRALVVQNILRPGRLSEVCGSCQWHHHPCGT